MEASLAHSQRQERFCPVPGRALSDARLTALDHRVLACIAGADLFGANGQHCFLKQSAIALRVGSEKSSVCKSIKRLVEYGYLELVSVPKDKRKSGYKVVYDSRNDGAAMDFRSQRGSGVEENIVHPNNLDVDETRLDSWSGAQPTSSRAPQFQEEIQRDNAHLRNRNTYSIQTKEKKEGGGSSRHSLDAARDSVRDSVVAKLGGWTVAVDIPVAELNRLCDLELKGKLTND